jgi:acyl-CoA synthetase (AMP-forming)/AMP-acid ligase II
MIGGYHQQPRGELPRNPTGKVLKRELRDRAS